MKKILAIVLAALMLAGCGNKAGKSDNPDNPDGKKDPSTTKSTAAEELIGEEGAVKIALEDFKSGGCGAVSELISDVSADDAVCEMSALNGIPVYRIEIKKGCLIADYQIDSQNGAIRSALRFFDNNIEIGYETDYDNAVAEPEKAADFAAWYFCLDRESLENLEGYYEPEKYLSTFIKFTADGVDYRCKIDRRGRLSRSNVDIGPDRASELCFAYLPSAVSEDQKEDINNLMLAGEIKNLSVAASGALDERLYEVSFNLAGFDYDFSLDAHSGKILSAQCNSDGTDESQQLGGFESVEGEAVVQPEVENLLDTDFPI